MPVVGFKYREKPLARKVEVIFFLEFQSYCRVQTVLISSTVLVHIKEKVY